MEGKPITAEVALRRLGKACELLAMNPNEMVDKAKKDLDGFQDCLEDTLFLGLILRRRFLTTSKEF